MGNDVWVCSLMIALDTMTMADYALLSAPTIELIAADLEANFGEQLPLAQVC